MRQPPHARRSRPDVPALRQQAGARSRHIQIGPRIRVGGSVGHFGEQVKQNLGQVAKIAAVPVGFVNPALGMALAAGGRALHTNEGAAGFGDLAGAAIKNYGTGKALHAGSAIFSAAKKGLPSAIGAIMNRGGAGGSSGIPGAPAGDGGAAGGVEAGGGGAGGGFDWGSLLGSVGGFVQNHGSELALGGLAAANAAAAAKASGRAADFQDKSLNFAQGRWDAGAPLRTQGMTGLTAPTHTDLSAQFATPNVFSKARRVPIRSS